MPQAQSSSEFQFQRFVDVERARICCRCAGQGPALVFLHGFPLSGLTWRRVVASLSDRFRCYAFDLIGLGDSLSSERSDAASERQGRLFQRALEILGVQTYVLIGNDTGGWIARELALIDKNRVSRLVLTNTEIPGHRPPWIPVYQKLVLLPGSALVLRRMLASGALRRSALGFGGCFVDLNLIEGEFFDLFLQPLLASPQRIAGMCNFLAQMNFSRLDQFKSLHGRLTTPVDFLWSADDPTFPESRARAMLDQFPRVAGFSSIAGAKLFSHEERPDAVAAFLQETLAAPAGSR